MAQKAFSAGHDGVDGLDHRTCRAQRGRVGLGRHDRVRIHPRVSILGNEAEHPVHMSGGMHQQQMIAGRLARCVAFERVELGPGQHLGNRAQPVRRFRVTRRRLMLDADRVEVESRSHG